MVERRRTACLSLVAFYNLEPHALRNYSYLSTAGLSLLFWKRRPSAKKQAVQSEEMRGKPVVLMRFSLCITDSGLYLG
jgi:hypothetical protein